MRRALIITAIVLTVFAALVAIPQSQAGASAAPRPTRPHAPIRAYARNTRVRSDPCRPGDAPCWRNHINRRIWMAELARQQRYARLLAYAAAIAAAQCRGYGCVQGIRVCDAPGLVPCWIVRRESRFDPRARNRSSSAGGLYQMLTGTFHHVCPAEQGRYGNAANAPVTIQVECSRRLVAQQGLRPWAL